VAPKLAWLAYWLMIIGTLVTTVAVLGGNSSVMFTAYPPMQADWYFYLGYILFAVGALIACFLFLANLTVAYRGRGVVAFDLAGAEYNFPAKKHKDAFYTVIDHNMATTVHAGEAYGAESISQALHYCHADRIGHGTRLYENPDLEAYVADRRVPLEICITSNLQTHAVASAERHPVRRYFDLGMVVCLNTDNRLMSATTVTEELWIAHTRLGFTRAEIERTLLFGFESAFLPLRERQTMVERITRELAAIQ